MDSAGGSHVAETVPCAGGMAKVTHMLQAGMNEESSSPWCSLIVAVLKPGCTLWLCNDFRSLNDIFNIS